MSLPNKLFEYVAAGLPVLGSDLPAIGGLIKGTESACSPSRRIRPMSQRSWQRWSGRSAMRRSAMPPAAAARELRWEAEAQRLVEAYEAAKEAAGKWNAIERSEHGRQQPRPRLSRTFSRGRWREYREFPRRPSTTTIGSSRSRAGSSRVPERATHADPAPRCRPAPALSPRDGSIEAELGLRSSWYFRWRTAHPS